MKLKKFRPKASQAGSLVGTRLVYSPVNDPLWSAAQDQRSIDSYNAEIPEYASMRQFYVDQKVMHEALASKVGDEVTIQGCFGQSGSWPPLFQVVFADGLATTLGVNELSLPA